MRDGFGRTAATTAAAAASATRIGEVDDNRTTIELRIVHIVNGCLGLPISAKSHKTKTTRTPGLAITHHDRLFIGRYNENVKGQGEYGWCHSRTTKHMQGAYVNNLTILRKALYH
jgi:hypothetical protein